MTKSIFRPQGRIITPTRELANLERRLFLRGSA